MMLDKSTRITPKFRESNNFNNVLAFLLDLDEGSVDYIRDMSNMDSSYPEILNEIGKLLGAYPRPVLPTNLTGGATGSTPFRLDESLLDTDVFLDIVGVNYFALDQSPLDTVPFASDDVLSIRPLSDVEYSRYLKAISLASTFDGYIYQWEEIIYQAVEADAIFINDASKFYVIVKKDINDLEKGIIERILDYNILTVNVEFIGTTDESTTLWALDTIPLDIGGFAKPW